MPRISSLLLGLFAILAGGCIPVSKSPLSDPSAARVDHELLGKWRNSNPDQSAMEFRKSDLKDAPAGLMMVVSSKPFFENGNPDPMHFFVTKVGKFQLANVLFTKPENGPLTRWDPSQIDGYLICRYSITEKGLSYGILSDEKIGTLIRTKGLIGSVEERANGRQTWIRDTTPDLVALLSHADADELFLPNVPELSRVK